MFVPEKKRLNAFKQCTIARNKDLFTRLGKRPQVAGTFENGGDELGQDAPVNVSSKIEQAQLAQKYMDDISKGSD